LVKHGYIASLGIIFQLVVIVWKIFFSIC
jgi:hypothetical protein